MANYKIKKYSSAVDDVAGTYYPHKTVNGVRVTEGSASDKYYFVYRVEKNGTLVFFEDDDDYGPTSKTDIWAMPDMTTNQALIVRVVDNESIPFTFNLVDVVDTEQGVLDFFQSQFVDKGIVTQESFDNFNPIANASATFSALKQTFVDSLDNITMFYHSQPLSLTNSTFIIPNLISIGSLT